MAAPSTSAPASSASAPPSASASATAGSNPFADMQTPSLVKDGLKPAPSAISSGAPHPPASAPSIESEQVIPPDPHTLAHGKYEAQKWMIWICVGVAAWIFALHILLRVRGHILRKRALASRLRSVSPHRSTNA